MHSTHRLAAAILAAGLVATTAGLDARERAREDGARLVNVRLCDSSACYYARRVVDSDGDGVADADEAVAGTDPRDPASTPALDLLVGLIGEGLLPSYSHGLAKLVLNPADLQAKLADFGVDGDNFPAFPLGERKEGVERLGISLDLLAEHGIDVGSSGLAVTAMFEREDGPPVAARVGGVRMDWISAGDDVDEPMNPPEVNDVVRYTQHEDGGFDLLLDNGDTIHVDANGHGHRHDANGNIFDEFYTNPDAEPVASEPTEEQVKAWKRMRGAVIRTVTMRGPIRIDPEDIVDPIETIVLRDPDHVGLSIDGMVSGPVDFNEAQPRRVPGQPNPQDTFPCTFAC